MKEVCVDELTNQTNELLDVAQSERVIVTRNGKPSAVLLGLEYKDEEDYALEHDKAFWRMIAERRKETKFYTLEEVKKRVGISTKKTRSGQGARKSKKRKTVS